MKESQKRVHENEGILLIGENEFDSPKCWHFLTSEQLLKQTGSSLVLMQLSNSKAAIIKQSWELHF